MHTEGCGIRLDSGKPDDVCARRAGQEAWLRRAPDCALAPSAAGGLHADLATRRYSRRTGSGYLLVRIQPTGPSQSIGCLRGLRPDVAHALVSDELFLDGNARQNLATFCPTWLDPEVHQLMDASIDKNMIDKDEYPATAELEKRCVHILADLWNSPKAATRSAARPPDRARRACWAGWH